MSMEHKEATISGATAEAFSILADHALTKPDAVGVSGWSNNRFYGANNYERIVFIDFDSCTDNHFIDGEFPDNFTFDACKCHITFTRINQQTFHPPF